MRRKREIVKASNIDFLRKGVKKKYGADFTRGGEREKRLMQAVTIFRINL